MVTFWRMYAGTPYETLGLDRTATDDDVRAARRRLAAEVHPDRHGSCDEANRLMREVNAAADELLDPQKRRTIDAVILRREEENRKAQKAAAQKDPAKVSPGSTASFSKIGFEVGKEHGFVPAIFWGFVGHVVDEAIERKRWSSALHDVAGKRR